MYTCNLVHLFIATDRPALKHLYMFVHDIATKWFFVGVALFDVEDETVLDTIKTNHPGDADGCTAEMLRLWRERNPIANWNQLLIVLRMPHIKLNALAAKIEGMLYKGMYVCIMSTIFTSYSVVYTH